MKIFQQINNIMADIEAIKKERKNLQQGYSFRGIDDMYNALHPLFSKHNVFITSRILNSKREERQTKSGGNLIYSILLCEFNFYTNDGSCVSSQIEGEAMDSGDKSTNKALSTALKYAVMQMFLIPTIDMVDNDSKTYEVSKKIEPSKTFEKQKPTLTEIQFKAMMEALPKDLQKVENSISKYEIKKEWMDELLAAIEFEKKLK